MSTTSSCPTSHPDGSKGTSTCPNSPEEPAGTVTPGPITYLGPAGTFTEEGLMHFIRAGHCGGSESEVDTIPVDSPKEALEKVANGEAAYACVAIESSVDGPVTPTFDALALGAPLQIYREVDIPIEFSILGKEGINPAEATTFSCHPVARPQVAQWFEKNAPSATFVPASSNAAAAKMASLSEVDIAAAPARAGEIYSLTPIATHVADVGSARTRFVLVGKPGVPTAQTGRDRTSVVFNVANKPGALAGALAVMASHGVDLTRIESRPTRKHMGEYRFYMDMAGHIEDPHVASALHDLHQLAAAMRFLGSWPMSDRGNTHPTTTTPEWLESQSWVEQRRSGLAPGADSLW